MAWECPVIVSDHEWEMACECMYNSTAHEREAVSQRQGIFLYIRVVRWNMWPWNKFSAEELISGKGHDLMSPPAAQKTITINKKVISKCTTCYDLIGLSLVLTGDLKLLEFLKWQSQPPRANPYALVDPEHDQRIRRPHEVLPHHIVGFYRRLRPNEQEVIMSQAWFLFHVVRTTSVRNSAMVIGGNNGDRTDGRVATNPLWSKNDLAVMFDWTGQETPSIHIDDALPAERSFTTGGKEQFVGFMVSVSKAAKRMRKYSKTIPMQPWMKEYK